MKVLKSIFCFTLVLMISLISFNVPSLSASEPEVLDLDNEIVLTPKQEEQMFNAGTLPDEYVVKNDKLKYGQYVKKELKTTKTNYRTYAYVPGFSKNVKRSQFCWGSTEEPVTVGVNFGASFGVVNASVSLATGGGTKVDCRNVSSSLQNVGTDIKDYSYYTAKLYDYKYYDSSNNQYLYTVEKATLSRSGALDYRAVEH